MELSSKPKPVRIRISIGGKEHTTIDSLKENMTPEILDFIDGRLQRWLKQQNLDELSGVIDAINKEKITSGQKLLRIYNCFFGKGYKKILFFVDEWQKNIRSKSLLKYYFENKDKETLVSVSLPDTGLHPAHHLWQNPKHRPDRSRHIFRNTGRFPDLCRSFPASDRCGWAYI